MLILGIETSCDETAAAIVRDGREILSNVVVSQIDIFAEYGGVIPEVAARSHLEAMMPVVNKALSDASCTWDDIDAIAVTHAPGLLGSLLIGTLTARTLAILHDKPLYAVHHLKSHVYANWLNPEWENCSSPSLGALRVASPSLTPSDRLEPIFPLLALVISGGHTQILYMPEHDSFEIIGTTHDDAVGECFDKVAKILGLPYPGGPSIAKAANGEITRSMISSSDTQRSATPLANKGARPSLRSSEDIMLLHQPGDSLRYKLPHPKVDGLDFSFSGLKTAVLRAVQKETGVPISYPSHKLKELLTPQQVADFAASFQKTAVDILREKLSLALEMHPDVQSVVIAGGVSANEELRKTLMLRLGSRPSGPSRSVTELPCSKNQASSVFAHCVAPSPRASGAQPRAAALRKSLSQSINVFFPSPQLSGDNGAMVAAAAYYEVKSGVKPTDPYTLNIYPRVSIEN